MTKIILHPIIKQALEENHTDSLLNSAFAYVEKYPSLMAYNLVVRACAKKNNISMPTKRVLLDSVTAHCANEHLIPTQTMIDVNEIVKLKLEL